MCADLKGASGTHRHRKRASEDSQQRKPQGLSYHVIRQRPDI